MLLFSFPTLDAYMKTLEEERTPLAATTDSTAKRKTAAPAPGDKKRKAKGSQGVEKLKKANVTGMAKLSNFFKKA